MSTSSERRTQAERTEATRAALMAAARRLFAERGYADVGVGDFLLGSMTPVDWQTIELVAETVAPALKAAVTA